MRIDDPDSYTSGGDHNGSGNLWKYGIEIWCNMEGQHVSIVADLSDLRGQNYEMSLCSLGIMGVEYIRDISVPNTVTLCQNSINEALQIHNIYAA